MSQPTTSAYISSSANMTMLLLVTIDLIGIIVMFNLNHWMITGALAADLLITWKLTLIAGFIFLYYYLMDLYTFDSPLSQLGMLERSFIATVLTGITVALTVYILGPKFIGGFVGRGVLTSSLLCLWLWSLFLRYLINNWVLQQRKSIQWLVLAHQETSQFSEDFHSIHSQEKLLVLFSQDYVSKTSDTDDVQDALTTNQKNSDTQLVGTWDDIDKVLETEDVTGIIITAPNETPAALLDKLMAIRIRGMRIYTLNDFYEKYLSRVPIFALSQQWLAMAHGFELIHNPIGLRFKRYVDIFIALVGGFFFIPILAIAAIAILLDSGLPIIYRQKRVGENGEIFTVYKLRTMITNAESTGVQFTQLNDPRITRAGYYLRKFRLDELPQLWNVLLGQMSFVGPRPERPEFTSELQKIVPYYNLRHIVKPGITGWAQVMYGYGDSSTDAANKLQYDLYYVKNYSLILDISIIIKSAKVILFGVGR
ncbi:MAG: exopolysaccharide biosynthesis polyprenyl glycosylphosphotransferase [Candidatus Azotimanducaceae bacterium]|jgi:exopolysaccharide biosynthesis polyprenyl glycosylphosphotransferase